MKFDNINLQHLEKLLLIISNDQNLQKNFIIRGSILYRQRINKLRRVKDLDVYIDPTFYDLNKLSNYYTLIDYIKTHIIQKSTFYLENISTLEYFKENSHIRFYLKDSTVSNDNTNKEFILDVGRDAEEIQYIPFEYCFLDGGSSTLTSTIIYVSPIFTDLAWKIQLVIHAGWRAKDVCDANEIYYHHNNTCEFHTNFWASLMKILKYTNTPLSKLNLITERKLGKSRAAKLKWRNWQKETGDNRSISEIFDILFNWLTPIINAHSF
jgi:hypothetical protein